MILDVLANKPPYADILDRHFFIAALRAQIGTTITQNSYEAFKNVGFQWLSNDSLWQHIIYLFEEVYHLTKNWTSYNNRYASESQSYHLRS